MRVVHVDFSQGQYAFFKNVWEALGRPSGDYGKWISGRVESYEKRFGVWTKKEVGHDSQK